MSLEYNLVWFERDVCRERVFCDDAWNLVSCALHAGHTPAVSAKEMEHSHAVNTTAVDNLLLIQSYWQE